jgi:mono/diheme cytochrome c family protein
LPIPAFDGLLDAGGALMTFTAALVACGLAGGIVAGSLSPVLAARQTQSGWQLPPDAASKKSPLTVDEKVLAMGKAVYKDQCGRCHGPSGLGDGPDADPDVRDEMNLTSAKMAAENPDGVVFYKVQNGRRRPKMPAFKDELTEQQVWSVVAYVQTLRRK